jgi:hypothetical protein
MATPSTSQSNKNQTMGVTMPRSTVKGCSSFVNLRLTVIAAAAGGATSTGATGSCFSGEFMATPKQHFVRGNQALYAQGFWMVIRDWRPAPIIL